MIIEFKKEHIRDISEAQVYSWKEAFKGILSDELLSNLVIANFESNWKKILTQKERSNFISLSDDNKAVGFISFGKSKDKNDNADFEIYGIYVHPSFWGKRIGYELMNYAIASIMKIKNSSRVILWTMSKNKLSRKFYEQYGFKTNGIKRISKRNAESFEEVQFEIKRY